MWNNKYINVYVINVFTVTFDQFDASLLCKSINFFLKKKRKIKIDINSKLNVSKAPNPE